MPFEDQTIYLAGHRGMVGSAIHRALQKAGCSRIITKTHAELDLRSQAQVSDFYSDNQIDRVIIAAAKVGGIHANNTLPADFIYDNLMIQTNLIHGAYQSGITKLLFLGSSCIYPRLAQQPIDESQLLTGLLEPTNEAYAIAKIAGIKMCESYNRQYQTDYRSLMPTNLYGPGDYFHPQNSHVIPALIRRFYETMERKEKSITLWGSGKPLRDFLHVDDLAGACLHIMTMDANTYWQRVPQTASHINVGSGAEISIAQCAQTIAEVLSFDGTITYDTSMPDGMPRKLLDISLIKELGWQPSISFADGIRTTCRWFEENHDSIRDA